MVQGKQMKPARQQKKKTALKHRNQEKTRSKEGVIKTAQKPRASQEGVRQQLKLKKRLTGAISSHIEQVMMARVQEDRGKAAPSQLKVLKKEDNYMQKMSKKQQKGMKNQRKKVKEHPHLK